MSLHLLFLLHLKSRALYIVSSLLLIGALLFAQIGVNFFHNNHNVHENKSVTTPLNPGEAGVQKHDEHCKVCSIDFFNHAFISSAVFFTDHHFSIDHKKQTVASIELVFVSFTHGRAPPII